MRIAIDHSAGFNQGAGIGRYARNLVPALAEALPDATFTIWHAPEDQARFASAAMNAFEGRPGVRSAQTRISRRRMDQLWFRLRAPIPLELWTGRQDLVYSPDFTAPPALRTPRIVTVHDLAYAIVPERAPAALRCYLSQVVPRAVSSAAAVIAVSETTKRDLSERMSVPPERVTVVPNAADERFFRASPPTLEERRALGLPERYLLTVGTIEPRKNHLNLFKALDLIGVEQRVPLVIAGRVGWSAEAIVAAARERAARGDVILLDYWPDEHLPSLYAGAEAVIYPSWYEGFGLPVLEGLAAGVPVIASDVPSHRETAGDQAVFVPPGDPVALADAILDALESKTSAADVEARRARASRYSWRTSGALLAAVINEVLSR